MMNSISCILVDDDKVDRLIIYAWLKAYPFMEIAGIYESPREALEAAKKNMPDCLFLDVVVPQPIFDKAGKDCGAPVLVWIYGGGYTTGSKSSWGNPAGLLARSEEDDQPGVIVSALSHLYQLFFCADCS